MWMMSSRRTINQLSEEAFSIFQLTVKAKLCSVKWTQNRLHRCSSSGKSTSPCRSSSRPNGSGRKHKILHLCINILHGSCAALWAMFRCLMVNSPAFDAPVTVKTVQCERGQRSDVIWGEAGGWGLKVPLLPPWMHMHNHCRHWKWSVTVDITLPSPSLNAPHSRPQICLRRGGETAWRRQK